MRMEKIDKSTGRLFGEPERGTGRWLRWRDKRNHRALLDAEREERVRVAFKRMDAKRKGDRS